jgi:phosphatidylserine/phosphatidylglycerophosphate/cardiolipin synthase-like enzyme
LEADCAEIPVAIAQTAPEWRGAPAIDEIATLTIDMLAAARDSIYVETQYFTARAVRDWMEKSLAAPHGPEIVVLVKHALHGKMEQLVMANNRERVIRRLRRADRHDRLRVFYPVVVGRSGACEVSVHAKVMIVDDDIIRVGSSNLNNRSMGLDTECDLVVEAHDDNTRRTIADIRERLLGEHLDVGPAAVRETMAAEQSLIRTIDRLNRKPRGLRPFPEKVGPMRSIPGTWLLDPQRPFEPLWWRRRKRRA